MQVIAEDIDLLNVRFTHGEFADKQMWVPKSGVTKAE